MGEELLMMLQKKKPAFILFYYDSCFWVKICGKHG